MQNEINFERATRELFSTWALNEHIDAQYIAECHELTEEHTELLADYKWDLRNY